MRVFFVSGAGTAGAAMANAIKANNPGVTPQPGFIYRLVGGGSTSVSTTPILGTSSSYASSGSARVAVSPQGNIYQSDGGNVYFFDLTTGYFRLLFSSSNNVAAGASCGTGVTQTSLSPYSDGCPASDSKFSAVDVSIDGRGNLYMIDSGSNTTNNIVRKVLAQGFASETVGTSLAQTFQVHLPETVSGSVSTASASQTTNGDISLTALTASSCSQNTDKTVDCKVLVTATPSAPGQRSADVSVTLPSGTSWTNATAAINLSGNASGSALVVDSGATTSSGTTIPVAPATTNVFGSIVPAGVAVDGAGNVYVMDKASGGVLESIGGSVFTLSTGLPSTPEQIAVDAAGNIFTVGSGTPTVQKLQLAGAGSPATYTATSLSYTPASGTPSPSAVAVDAAGNVYVADYQSGGASIYKLSLTANTLQTQTTVATGLSNPVSLAVDGAGNIYAADQGAHAVLKFAPGLSAGVYTYVSSTLLSSVTPAAVAVDAAGDVYVQDMASASVLEIPVSGPSTVTVLTGLSSPSGLAVNGQGNVYSADTSLNHILKVVRNATTENFGTSTPTIYGATLTNAGNLAATGENTTNSNTINFTVTGGSNNGCAFSSNILGAVPAGTACTLSANLTGSGTTVVYDYLSFLPSASTVGVLTLEGQLQGTSYPTSTTVSGPSQPSPIYSPSGTEATFTVTVSSSTASSAPVGSVDVYVDSTSSFTQYTLSQVSSTISSVSVPVSGLIAGTHTIAVVYPTTGMFTGSGSVSSTTSFTISPTGTAVSWTPGATTQQVSAAIGTSVLNPTVLPATPGTFIYSTSATPSCNSTNGGTINSATYLPIGSYTLYATFCPMDSNDYNSSSASVSNYTVTAAATTAAVGASTNVVAADGTGNYTTLSAALVALPTTGGTIYIKPGTYSGQNAITYPNVYLRGLGGDPTKVILTAEDGAFSSPYFGYLGTGTGAGNASAGGDQGSSTLDITSGTYMGETSGSTSSPIGSQSSSSHNPNNLYAEYLTIQNTWDYSLDTTYIYYNGSSCLSSATAATLQFLYNNGEACAGQALAVWMTSDQAILNNVNLYSQQDTLLAGSQGCGSTCTAAREYMWKGLISGDVDYVFGDAALVFDHTTFFTTYHGSATGTNTIEAQNKHFQTGSSSDYLSGYICNGCTLLSQGPGMTNLYYGRPYGPYSTWIMLDSSVDQVAPTGWIEFSGDTNLPTSTYGEYNTMAYTDPAVGVSPYPAAINGATPVGGNTGSGATSFSSRETTSAAPGTLQASNADPRLLTASEAAQYYPINFLSTPIPSANLSSGQSSTWNPVTSLASLINAFAPTAPIGSHAYGASITILGRPETPGAGIVPTGSYAFYDSIGMNQVCTAVSSGCTQLASGSLDASGEAYLTTGLSSSITLQAGTHYITMVYGGDSNFAGSTSATYAINIAAQVIGTTTALTVTNPSSTYGGTIGGTVTVTPASGSDYAVGTVTLSSGSTSLGTCALNGTSNTCGFSLTNVPAGVQTMIASFGGGTSLDGTETLGSSTSGGVIFTVNQAVLHVAANNATMIAGASLPTFTYTTNGYVNSDTSAMLSGAPSITTASTGTSIGEYPISIATGTLASSNYTFTFSGSYLYVTGTAQAPAVATGDTRTVTEPSFPAVCQQLNADIAQVNNDIPTSVDTSATPLTNANLINPTVTNPDGGRIQAALNACSASYPGSRQGLAVELSVDGAGNNAFLAGPLTIPSNVTLLVDPGVVLFFSRNARDYDLVQGNYQCGTISTASNVCQSMVTIPKTATNVGVMGYGKLDGRSSDPLLNAIPPYQGYSWLGLAAAYVSPDGAQVPPFVTITAGATNVTLYKITIRNAANRHIGDGANGSTIWDVKLITPTSGRNTDGIDTGNSNITITRSWISDGDDNVAIGAANTPADNISVTHNHLFAGHGQSIGSYTGSGVSNVLWDGNIAAGNGFVGSSSAAHGSAVSGTGTFLNGASDNNSTGVRIKTANDRGGLVTGIQYSNECMLDHGIDIQFTPYYSTGDSTNAFPNYKNILLQNVVFANDDSSTGSVEFTGEFNTNLNGTPSPVINPIYATLDNVTFPSALSNSSLVNSTTPYETTSVWGNGNYSGGTGQYADLTYGPGDVSANFITAFGTLVNVAANNDTVTNNITATSLNPPACSYTYIAPELTGPTGLPQAITSGQNTSAVVILTPAVGGAAYPTGTVTLTDALTSTTYTATLPGNTDTLTIPLPGLAVGTHTFTATYSGDTNYVVPNGQTVYTATAPYDITVNAGSLNSTTTAVGLPLSTSITSNYGTPIIATATVTGSNPTGSVQFVVSGGGLIGSYTYATAALASSTGTTSTASASINLPLSSTAYSITAVYSGDLENAGSTSSVASLTVGAAATVTTVTPSASSAAVGNPLVLTATVTSVVGTPVAATVTFAYSTTPTGAQTTLGTAALYNGSSAYFVNSLPIGTYYLHASYPGAGSFGASSSTVPTTITVTAASNIVQLFNNPIALPYTITTIAGGGAPVPSSGNMLCTGATDKYGDGCQAIATAFTSGDDLRGVDADPFGNVYVTDGSAARVRRIAPNGIITTFAGGGSTCTLPTSTSAIGTGCTPTLVTIGKTRGVSSDAAGNIYIADYADGKVYEVKVSDGLMYLVAGNGTSGTSGDGGPAVSAELASPRSAWGDSVGNIYIADTSNERVRVVDTAGNIHTFAGVGGTTSTGDGGPALSANFDNPQGVFADPNLNVYVTDSLGRIRVVCVTCGTGSPLDTLLSKLGITSPVNGDIYTVAGSGSSVAYTGSYPILSTSVSMSPQKLSMDNAGNLYISDSNGIIWLLDFHTGYIRAIAKSGTVCSSASNTYGYKSYGDGCPATQASFGSNGGNGFGVGTDTQGNLYIGDTTNQLIRKVITGLASPSTATAATTALPEQLHFTVGDTLASSNGLAYTSSEWTLGTPSCTTNGDSTADCLFTSSFTPAVPGLRSTPLTVNSSLGNKANLGLTGVGVGAGATLDPATQVSFGSGLSVAGLAADNAGNIYVSDANSNKLYRYAPSAIANGTSATGTVLATLGAPGAVAVDARGYVYVADISAGTVTQISPAGSGTVLPFTFSKPAGLAVDALNNLYVSDSSAQAVYQVNPITGASKTLVGKLIAPAGLAIDPSDNLLITDPGAPAIYRYSLQSGVTTTVSSTAVKPSATVTDAAGNLLIADTAQILAVPASTNSASFVISNVTPSGFAIDSAGNLYTGQSGAVLVLMRTKGYFQFAGPSAAPQSFSMLESGNSAFAGTSFSQTDSADYSLAPTASTDCTLSSAGAGGLAIGGVCALTATYTPTTYSTTTDAVTFNGNLTNAAFSSPSMVELMLTGPATAPASTITLGSSVPASPVYGQAVTLSATVSGAALTPTGTVVFTVDTSTYSATVSNGVATAMVTGLNAGTHSLSASYTSSNGYMAATQITQTIVVNQATPAITWPTPAAISYGTALSATQLDASSTVAGTFAYSPAAGTVLGAGSQTLSVLFTPTDTTDYATATAKVTLAVNQASLLVTANSPAIAYGAALPAYTATITGFRGTDTAATAVTGAASLTTVPAAPSAVGSYTITAAQGTLAAANYTFSFTNGTLTIGKATSSLTGPALSAQPVQVAYNQTGSIPVTVAGQYSGTGITTPTGTISYTIGTGSAQTAAISNGTATVSIPSTQASGLYTVAVTYAGDANYSAATALSFQVQVGPQAQSITFNPLAPVTYGVAPIALSGTATSGLAVTFTVKSGPATLSGNMLTVTGAGSVVIAADQAGNTLWQAAAEVTQTLTVGKAAPAAIGLASSSNPVLVQNAVTLTATVSSATGSPTGTVTFLDGATPLGTGALAGGMATLTTSSLAVGSHTITAVYGGDGNFVPATSAALTEVVDDFNLAISVTGGASSTTSVTVFPGGMAVFTFIVSPINATTFPAAVTLSASGLPTGAIATFSPATLPAGSGTTTGTLTIQIPQTTAAAQPSGSMGRRLAPFALALLLLPFAGRLRRAGKRLGRMMSVLLLLAAGAAAVAGLSGCGSTSGFFGQQQTTYTVTVTGTSGALSHSATVTLTVE
jgi:sugar lactone lactonase YvrE